MSLTRFFTITENISSVPGAETDDGRHMLYTFNALAQVFFSVEENARLTVENDRLTVEIDSSFKVRCVHIVSVITC